MKFLYRPSLTLSPGTGEVANVLRPEVPIRVFGPNGFGLYLALVDTGSDNTVLPLRIASDLGIPVTQGIGPEVTAFGGQKLRIFLGEVELELGTGDTAIRWPIDVHFFEFGSASDEILILGHAGFLDFFTASFDGAEGSLTLQANGRLPARGES